MIGILCWSALAFAIARSVRHPVVQRAVAGLVLLLGLCIQVTEWDQILLSESLSVSLSALVVAALLSLRLRATPRVVAAALLVVTLWVFARQLQSLVYIVAAVFVVAWILLKARRLLIVAAVLVLLGVWSGYAVAEDKGHLEFGAHEVVALRILQVPDGAPFLAAGGMPDLTQLEQEAAAYASHGTALGGESAAYRDPVWQKWVDRHWVATYGRWLLRHPKLTVRQPFNDVPLLLDGFPNLASNRAVLPTPVQDLLWERASGGFPFLLVVTLLVWVVSLRRGRPGSLDALAGAGFFVCVVWYAGAWFGQATELPRLMIPVAATMRILIVLALAASAGRLVTGAAAEGPGPG